MSKQSVAAKRKQEWRDRLARQAVSGQTVAAFCRSEAVTEGTFYAWRARLGAGNRGAGRVEGTTKPSLDFIDIGALNDLGGNKSTPVDDVHGGRGSSSGIEVRLDLGQGVVLHVRR